MCCTFQYHVALQHIWAQGYQCGRILPTWPHTCSKMTDLHDIQMEVTRTCYDYYFKVNDLLAGLSFAKELTSNNNLICVYYHHVCCSVDV